MTQSCWSKSGRTAVGPCRRLGRRERITPRAVEREVVEESGYQVRATKVLAVLDRAKHPHVPPFPFHIYKLFILCDLIGGLRRASTETEEVGFFPENGIPQLSVARTTSGQIMLFEHHRRPDLASDFD